MIRADVWLPDPASVLAVGAFGAGALIRLERSDDAGVTYAEITTIAIVATTVTYHYWDATGDETSLYRWRVSDSSDTDHSPYSPPFAGTSPTAAIFPTSYASLPRLLTLFETQPTAPARLARLGTLLGTATQQVIDECGGRDYFRHPAVGTATWTVDVGRDGILHCHDGIVSLSSVEISLDGGTSWSVVTSTDYILRGDDPESSEAIPAGEPFFHVRTTGFGSTARFQRGVNAARLTGARGWPAVPETLTESTAQRARQLAFGDLSFSGSAPGNQDQYGASTTSDRFWPQSLYNFLRAQSQRFIACRV